MADVAQNVSQSAPQAPPQGAEPQPGPAQEREADKQVTVESVADEMRKAAAKRQVKDSKGKFVKDDASRTTPAMESKDEAAGSAGADDKGWHNPIADLLKSEYGPKETKEPTEEDLGVEPKSRAAEAITSLRKRSQEAESKIQQYDSAYRQVQTQVQQIQTQAQQTIGQYSQALQQVREQNAAMAAKLEMLTSGSYQPQQKEPDYGQQFLNKSEEHFRKTLLEPALAPLQKELAERRQAEADAQKEQRINSSATQLQNSGLQAWQQYVVKDLPEQAQNKFRNLGTAAVIALQGATGQPFPQVAAQLRRLVLETAHDIVEAQRQSTISAAEKAKSVPRTLESSGGGKDNNSQFAGEMPPMKQLLQNGFSDPAEWARAGKPKLKQMKP